jgi:hypothetical protein
MKLQNTGRNSKMKKSRGLLVAGAIGVMSMTVAKASSAHMPRWLPMFAPISPKVRLPFLALCGFFLASCASGPERAVSSSANAKDVQVAAQPDVVAQESRAEEGDVETRNSARFAKACESGEGAACWAYSLRLERGFGIPIDKKRAVEVLTTTCDQGYAPACKELAIKLADGRGVGQDEVRAVELHAKACELAEATSCARVVAMLEEGRGVGQDPQRVRSLLGRACEAGEARACVAADTHDCNAGNSEGCYHLALMLDEGHDVAQDRARADELYAKACKGGQDLACAKGALRVHYAAMLKGLDARNLASCRDKAPSDAIRMTVRVLRLHAGAPLLPMSDLNWSQEPPAMVSSQVERLSTRTGEAWLKQAREILAAPATLVVQVKSEVPAIVVDSPSESFSFFRRGRFKPGSLTVRLVRFDSKAKATCATEVTLKNQDLELQRNESVVDGARRQLREWIPGAFGF